MPEVEKAVERRIAAERYRLGLITFDGYAQLIGRDGPTLREALYRAKLRRIIDLGLRAEAGT